MKAYERILKEKIVAIIRGAQPKDVLPIALALKSGGVQVLEVTINSPDAIKMIGMLSAEVGNEMLVGAGTVLDGATAKEAIDAGAQFIISPIVDVETIKVTREYGAVSIPGAYTATEIHTAFKSGGQIIKVFPASAGPGYIKDIRGPLPHIPLMPTGGVDLENISAFQQAGAVAFGIATALVDTSKEMNASQLKEITAKAKRYRNAISLSDSH
jgi:2-dehydro-3-deoxyphosphogluconate aldolase/(4S)-4-hydroxy-2-oxoglutarate aldolase